MFISGGSLVSLRRLSCLSVLARRASWPRVACDVRRVRWRLARSGRPGRITPPPHRNPDTDRLFTQQIRILITDFGF